MDEPEVLEFLRPDLNCQNVFVGNLPQNLGHAEKYVSLLLYSRLRSFSDNLLQSWVHTVCLQHAGEIAGDLLSLRPDL